MQSSSLQGDFGTLWWSFPRTSYPQPYPSSQSATANVAGQSSQRIGAGAKLMEESTVPYIMRGQSRRHSLLESSLNTASGFLLSFLATFVVYPLVGIRTSAVQNLWTVIAFTVISVLRSYVWRRVFNWWHHREAFYNN